jgi:hypothetical protein
MDEFVADAHRKVVAAMMNPQEYIAFAMDADLARLSAVYGLGGEPAKRQLKLVFEV